MQHVCHCSWTTEEHKTFGACMRAKGIRIAYCQSAAGRDYSAQKRWDKDLDSYAAARAEGIQPDSTRSHSVEMAKEWSDREGVAYGSPGGAE